MLSFTPFNYELFLGFLILMPISFVTIRKRWVTEGMWLSVVFVLWIGGIVLAFMERSGDGFGIVCIGWMAGVGGIAMINILALKTRVFPQISSPPEPLEESATSPSASSFAAKSNSASIGSVPTYKAEAELIEDELARRVWNAWPKLQKAWGEQRLDLVRSFLSDGMQIRTQIQLDAIRRRGVRNVLEGATVHRVKTIDQTEGVRYTTCTVEIEASGRDVDIELATGESRENGGYPSFKEYWTFMKRSGVTAPALGLLEGNCPSCGTPLEIGSATICPSCRSKIKSGEFDWVLTEISQVAPSRMAYANKVAADLIERDPGFTASGMEDHASMVFWKMVGSLASGGPAPSLGAYVSVDLVDTLAESSRRLAREEWFRLEPVVAAVELESLDQRTGFDLVEVRIRWQLGPKTSLSKPTQVDPVSQGMASLFKAFDPKLASKFDPAQMLASGRDGLEEDRKSVLLFERRVGQETSDDRNLTTSHCPSCGGPETPETGVACTWCGCSLEEQAGAWRLVKVKPGHGKLGI
jgi:predicted lipid-binding transport protein (Tim44 family)/uncharacterized Zn finger protein (UPF0148 family)